MPSIELIDGDKVLAGLKHAAATAENEEELRRKEAEVEGRFKLFLVFFSLIGLRLFV